MIWEVEIFIVWLIFFFSIKKFSPSPIIKQSPGKGEFPIFIIFISYLWLLFKLFISIFRGFLIKINLAL